MAVVGVAAKCSGTRLDRVLVRRLPPPLKAGPLHTITLDFFLQACDVPIGEWTIILLYIVFLFLSVHFAQDDFTPVVHKDGKIMGAAAGFNFMVVIMPVTRHSIWHHLMGCSFERAIKLHR